MPPSSAQQLLLSPAELSYLATSLTSTPPLRPDGRTTTQFRPLVAETDILPSANGSARICFADGTEAIVGVKAEVERSMLAPAQAHGDLPPIAEGQEQQATRRSGAGRNEWVELSVEIPGFREDDSMPVFMSAMLSEALLADGTLANKLVINTRWHWKLYLDVGIIERL